MMMMIHLYPVRLEAKPTYLEIGEAGDDIYTNIMKFVSSFG